MIWNCDQLPLRFVAVANSPPSTLYRTIAMGACGLVADPTKAKRSGSSRATIGEGIADRLIVGATAGNNRTMNVVDLFIVTVVDVPIGPGTLNEAWALIDSSTNDPQGVAGETVPVHLQFG